ncbi:hypothetical protein MTO96_044233 [Rhipicephalus appendiculatus]
MGQADPSPSNGSSLPYSGMAADAGGVVSPLSMAWVDSLTVLVASVTICPGTVDEGAPRHPRSSKDDPNAWRCKQPLTAEPRSSVFIYSTRPGLPAEPGEVIKDFLEMLNSTEKNSVEQGLKLFASQQTTQSLRVTLMSTLEIIEFLLDEGAHYVLTAKLNQDPVEVSM